MTISVSSDDGRSWPIAFLIDAGPSAYSDMVKAHRKKIGLVYEKGSDGGIVFVLVPFKKILKSQ